MYFCEMTRVDLLALMPKGGEIAEVGVAGGTFSRHILDIVKPERLHLIDLWEHQDDEDYQHDPNNVSSDDQEQRYQDILRQFAPEIARGQVVVHRSDSVRAAERFSANQLDWVFIDALHTKTGCENDLRAYQPKVKESGFILGHDYTNHGTAQQMGFGVVEAVDEFVMRTGYHFLLLTAENFPSYVLVRDPASPLASALCGNIALHVKGMTEIRDFPQARKYLAKTAIVNGTARVIHSF